MRRGILARIQQEIAANHADGGTGPMTLARYFPRWVTGREERGLISARDDRTRFAFHIAESYQWQTNTIKATKTEVPRWVPVHATLARVLAEWKLGGWTEMMGRSPRPDDFIVPPVPWRKQKTNLCRPPQSGLRAFHDDCKTVDIRTRRNHDSRRTFISLARAGGARLDLLTWITHGPSASIMDAYTTVPWSTLCEQVDAIKIRLLEGKVLQLPIAAVGGTREGTRGGKSATMTEDSGCALQDSNLSERL